MPTSLHFQICDLVNLNLLIMTLKREVTIHLASFPSKHKNQNLSDATYFLIVIFLFLYTNEVVGLRSHFFLEILIITHN